MQSHTSKCFLVTSLGFMPSKLKSILLFFLSNSNLFFATCILHLNWRHPIHLVCFLSHTFTYLCSKEWPLLKYRSAVSLRSSEVVSKICHTLPKSIFVFLGAWATTSAWPVTFDLQPLEGPKISHIRLAGWLSSSYGWGKIKCRHRGSREPP